MGMAATDSQFHVLAVDDSIIDRKLIERLLKTSSFQVTTVDSGSKALEFLGFREPEQSNLDSPSVSPTNQQEVEVNLVITDYCMPGMTGYDLLKKIKESSSLRDIPVVIMSSENVPSRINRCLEEGAEEFFLKPVKLADVNKLKPHMMKTKRKSEYEEIIHTTPETTTTENHHHHHHHHRDHKSEIKQAEEEEDLKQPPQTQSINSNKRKAMDEGLSDGRSRRRYNGITTSV